MSFKRVEPAQAVEWIRVAVRLLISNPVPFLLMGLATTMIAVVPYLGALALLIVGPVLYAGIMLAARTQAEGGQAEFHQLLEGFQQPGKVGPLVTLCLPSVGLVIAVFMIFVMVVSSLGSAELLTNGGKPIDPTELSAEVQARAGGVIFLLGLMIALVLMIALALATWALLFFAVPRVMFDGIEPFTALRESAQAAAANLGAFLLTVLTLSMAQFAATIVLGKLVPFFGVLVVSSVFTPLVSVVLYVAWKDVFGSHANDTAEASEPTPPPQVIEV